MNKRRNMRIAREMPDYDEYIHDVMDRAVSSIGESAVNGYDEVYGAKTEEIEHISRDGFWSSNDGGFEARGFTMLGYGQGGFPAAAQKIGDDILEYNREAVSDQMKSEHPEAFEDVEFVGWQEADDKNLTSEYEDTEQGWMEDDSVMLSVGAMYEDIDGNARGQDKHQCYVWAAINFEAPYHRRGRMEWYVSEAFEFSSEKELKGKLTKALRKVTSKM